MNEEIDKYWDDDVGMNRMKRLFYSKCPYRKFTVKTKVYESGVYLKCHMKARKSPFCCGKGQLLDNFTYVTNRLLPAHPAFLLASM